MGNFGDNRRRGDHLRILREPVLHVYDSAVVGVLLRNGVLRVHDGVRHPLLPLYELSRGCAARRYRRRRHFRPQLHLRAFDARHGRNDQPRHRLRGPISLRAVHVRHFRHHRRRLLRQHDFRRRRVTVRGRRSIAFCCIDVCISAASACSPGRR